MHMDNEGFVVLFTLGLIILLTWDICNARCVHNGKHALQ